MSHEVAWSNRTLGDSAPMCRACVQPPYEPVHVYRLAEILVAIVAFNISQVAPANIVTVAPRALNVSDV